MRLDSPYKKLIDSAILHLKEGGVLHRLKKKWWKTKRGGGACDAVDDGEGVAPLELASVAGAFLVTVGGCFVAVYDMMELFNLW